MCNITRVFSQLVEEAADGRVALNLTVPAAVKARLEQMRSETGKSISRS